MTDGPMDKGLSQPLAFFLLSKSKIEIFEIDPG